MRVFVGVDPGLTGALAILDDSGLRYLFDLPVMARGSKKQINPAALTQQLRDSLCEYDKQEIMFFIELVRPMPKQGVSSMLTIGLTAGLIEGVVAARGYAYDLVAPHAWKRAMGLTSDKEACRAKAIRYYPEAELTRKKDHNRAEALLLARWGQDNHA